MPPEHLQMTFAVPRPQPTGGLAFRPHDGEPAHGLRELFAPLDHLLLRGGDPRLALEACGLNAYGCGPSPSPDLLSFASSTASPISERAYARASVARDELMQSSIAVGFEEAFDARIEAMRETLRAHLGLAAADADIVFSPSGTDSQLHALFVARVLLGERLTTIVVGSDQTGSGTAFAARGHHFSAQTASGQPVEKDAPIAGLSGGSVALPLLDGADIAPRADFDDAVLDAVETAVVGGASVLLQIMDSSKLGWRAPSEACLGEIARRWPREVLIAVDACQMRLGRGRLRAYLDRGYLVLITGSKFFGGPAFSGALLVPNGLARSLDEAETIMPGLFDYASGSDWPKGWSRLRSGFASRQNLGQWLRWEAALEEMGAYYEVPGAFRAWAVKQLSVGLESLIVRSPSLCLVGSGLAQSATAMPVAGDEEFTAATILPFTIHTGRGPLSATDSRMLYQALTEDLGDAIAGSEPDRQFAANRCLVGQPVALERRGEDPVAVLRLCVGARHVSGMWSADAAVAQRNLLDELDRAARVIAKIEWLLGRSSNAEITGRPDARR
jgi:hypothetical protein